MRHYLSRILSVVFLVVLISAAVIFNVTKPRILILQSYDPAYPWTRDVDVGLNRIAKNWTHYSVVRHYMDTKRNGDSQWLERTGIIARRTIKRFDPHVLIAIDDLAQQLAAKYFVNDPQIQIVFAGVNGSVEPYGYNNAQNVTGIFERKQLHAVKEVILALESKKEMPIANPKIIYVLDASASLQQDRSFIDDYKWLPVEYQGSYVAENYVKWQQIIKQEGSKVDYIIVANYRKLPQSGNDPTYVNPQEVMSWTEENANVPVIGINSFNVEDGAAISIGVSPFEQGSVAAKMAETILQQKITANKIPMVQSKQYIVAIRESSMKMKHMKLPSIYEAFGRATENYIEE